MNKRSTAIFYLLLEKFQKLIKFITQSYLFITSEFIFISISLKCLDDYFVRWFAYKSLFSRFSVLISYNMWSSNHFSISSRFPCFSRSSFIRVQVYQGPGFSRSRFFRVQVLRVRVQSLGPGSRVRVQVLEVAQKCSSCYIL